MNRMWMMAVALCSCMTMANAQELTIANEVTDIGQTSYRIPVIADYEVTNTGNKPLVINNVEVSCGCVKVDYPKQPIQEGGKAHIRATFDAAQLGHFTKQLLVYSNADPRPALLIYKGVVVSSVQDFKGTYVSKIGSLEADRNDIEFDDVHTGEYPQQKIFIKNNTKKTIQPIAMHLPNYLKVDISPSKLAPGQSGVVAISLDSRLLNTFGLTQTSIFLGMFAGDKVSSDKEISVSAVLLPSFDKLSEAELQQSAKLELSNEVLELGSFDGKKKKKGEIEIKNVGQSVLDIRSIQMFTAGLRVDLSKTKLRPGEATTMKITADAQLLKSVKAKPRVLMITNDPSKPKVIITINVK